MLTVVNVCAGVCSALLLAWIVLQWWPRAGHAADRAGSACFFALGVTSVVALRALVVAPPAERGPLPVFVFLGAPIGFFLAWLSWRLARQR